MPYSVKLKDQTGSEITYNSIEQVALPKASGNGNAHFVAQYGVTKTAIPGITYKGGATAANSVDYMCRIEGHVPEAITVSVGGNIITEGYEYSKITDAEAIVLIKGSSITGDIIITASA